MLNNFKFFILLMFSILQLNFAFSIEVNDLITGRILKTSSSKKTILVNRGSADQLTLGMHAKFSTDTSVVARGVVVELSDNRSIWSLYRISTPDLVESDVVLNVKISEPVKITTDESRTLVRESAMKDLLPNRDTQLSLPLDDVEGDIPVDLLGANIASSKDEITKTYVELSNYPREMLTRVALQSLSSKTTSGSGSYSGRTEMNNFLLGTEFYFTNKEKWYAQFSLMPYFQYQYESMLSYEGSAVDSEQLQIGISAHYYFYNPNLLNKFNPFTSLFYAQGTVKDNYASGARSLGNGSTASSVKGNSTSMGIGIGVKYFFENRLAVQSVFEYYTRTDEFDSDPLTSNASWSREVYGPRVQLGLGYRF